MVLTQKEREKVTHDLLENVPGSYEDFVVSMQFDLKKYPQLKQPIVDYILEDTTRTPSDILGYYWQLEKRLLQQKTAVYA